MIDRELYLENVAFLFTDYTKMSIDYGTDDAEKEGFIVVKVGEKTKAFYPLEFCECFYASRARMADKALHPNGRADLMKQSKIFVSCKTNVTHIIERYKRFADNHPSVKKHDFEGFIRQVDTAIAEVKLNVEIALLNSQIETNKSQVRTNELSKTTNIYIAIFTYFGTLYSINEFLSDFLYEYSEYYNKEIVINTCLIVWAVGGIIGYRRIYQLQQRKNNTPKP